MFEDIAQFRRKLADGRICLGSGITLSDSSIVEAIAPSVDFFWIDLEHTHLSYETLQSHLIAARAGGTAALVRVRGSDIPHIKPILDIGAGGIIVPQVQTVEEVENIINACRFPPLGQRGFGPRRAGAYGRDGGIEWMQHSNREVFTGVQIENLSALAVVDDIARLDGLDSIVLGPYDLSVALGYPGEIGHPEVQAAMKRIISAARSAGKRVGTGLADSATEALKAIDLGVQWLQCGDDYSYMVSHVDDLMRQVRSASKSYGL